VGTTTKELKDMRASWAKRGDVRAVTIMDSAIRKLEKHVPKPPRLIKKVVAEPVQQPTRYFGALNDLISN
jgi:hypothetical protein